MTPAGRSPNPSPRGDLIDTAGASRLLGVPAKTLANWRHRKTGPPHYRVGQLVRYSPTEIDAWLDANRVTF